MLEGTFSKSVAHPSMTHGGPFLRSYVCANATRVNVVRCSRGTRVDVARSRRRVCSHFLARPSLDQLVQRGRSSALAASISSPSVASDSSSTARGRHIFARCFTCERCMLPLHSAAACTHCTARLSLVMAAKILRASDACTLYAMPPRVGQSCGRTVGNAPASTMLSSMLAAVPVQASRASTTARRRRRRHSLTRTFPRTRPFGSSILRR